MGATGILGHLFASGGELCVGAGVVFCPSSVCVAAGNRLFLCEADNFGDGKIL